MWKLHVFLIEIFIYQHIFKDQYNIAGLFSLSTVALGRVRYFLHNVIRGAYLGAGLLLLTDICTLLNSIAASL